MPDDRFLHRKAGHSEKVNRLTDLEFRVWSQYLLSADDFGVMRCSAVKLQADNDSLENRPARAIQKCLDALTAKGGLLHVFQHQDKPFVFQHDWQDWQKIEYPRGTNEPKPTPEAIEICSDATRELFEKHPGGGGKKKPKSSTDISGAFSESSPNVSLTFSESSPPTRAGAPAKRLTANGLRLTADGSEGGSEETEPVASPRLAPLHTTHKKHAACGRTCVPAFLHTEFMQRRNHDGADAELREWYLAVDRIWSDGGPHAADEPGDALEFWRAQYAERWPSAEKTNSRLPAWARP